ncbi:MAG TPA: hypothetical protein EYH45_00360 [Candidatus Caldiarchaeum subterraneum]|uniref:Uncharacterized protein n=1 Tax=Caldiarchaeum subterraneum TaxID=311458 RepID=A0A833E930_CALS0|nr:hypothetical protein [Aigarchaeota archaeon]HIQ28997.1 hypothetical protein [Candidatus Caldarchaeum subterraneum]
MSGALLSQPPRVKFLEALGALADGRVEVRGVGEALVRSSEGDRVYRVFVDVERGVAYSDDNGTVYRNYVGYPIVALLITMDKLPYDGALAEGLKGVRWREINERYKDYKRVEEEIKKMLEKRGIPASRVDEYISKARKALSKLHLSKSTQLTL